MSKHKDSMSRQKIVEWSRGRVNPMFSVNAAIGIIDKPAQGVSSTSDRYRRVYRLLESMTREGLLMCHGTKNGGNVYMLRERDRNSG